MEEAIRKEIGDSFFMEEGHHEMPIVAVTLLIQKGKWSESNPRCGSAIAALKIVLCFFLRVGVHY